VLAEEREHPVHLFDRAALVVDLKTNVACFFGAELRLAADDLVTRRANPREAPYAPGSWCELLNRVGVRETV
jgi:hypothetical protein